MTRTSLTAVLVTSAIAVAGCGINDPDAPAPLPAVTTAPLRQPPGAPGARVGPAAVTSGVEGALLARFARVWFTYAFATLPAQQRELAALATGLLARQLSRNGEADLQTQYVRVANVRSSGVVEAIVVRRHAAAIVVTHERLTTNGQAETSWQVYLATVTDTRAGLRVASWTPASSG